MQDQRIYQGFYTLYQYANHDLNQLLGYFLNSQLLTLNEKEMIIDQDIVKEVSLIHSMITKKSESREEQVALVEKLVGLGIKDRKIQRSLQLIQQSYL